MTNAFINPRNWKSALLRGFRLKCPNCGKGRMMHAYIKVENTCANCGEPLHHHKADDAPPYFTITLVAHMVVPALLIVEKTAKPPLWLHAAIWLPLTLFLSLWFLPRIKGSIVGLQWAHRMHGFGDQQTDE
jgi:uncharacterized protein (DUF983 family)